MAHSNQVRPREIKESPLGLVPGPASSEGECLLHKIVSIRDPCSTQAVRQDKINLNKAHLQFFEKCHWNRQTTSTGNIYKTTSTGNKV